MVLGGERQLETFTAAAPPATVEVRWRAVLGVRCPADARLLQRAEPERSVVGGSATLLSAAAAHRAVLEAAVRFATVSGALRQIEAELRLTAVRRNAIERRWIPAHEQALAQLELTLEELEREDAARVRRLTGSGGRPG